jgi:vanillin dehydrogenase
MNIAFIADGAAVKAEGGALFDRKDPMTGKVATRAAAATLADVEKVVAAAAKAFESWSETGASARPALLLKAADLMESRTADFVKLMPEETGATAPWAGFNVDLAAGIPREAAALTTQITGEVIPSDKPGILSMAICQPVGVVLGMAPWNAPVILGTRAIAAALACGNTVILRCSEICPGTHHLIGQVLNDDAGFPKGVVNVLSNAPAGAAKIVEALIAHPAIRRVNFTRSTKVGRIIATFAAEHLKPVLLELGGKAPLIVLDDADLDQAVDAAAFGAFMNQGQICMSTERVIVDDKVADAFVAKFAAEASKLPAGVARGHVVLGSLVDLAPAERMDVLIADAVAKGAKVVAGGKRSGTVVEATLLDHVTAAKIYSEESFGPVKSIIRVNGVDEAIRVANDTEYGLSAAIFGQDITRAMAVAKRIQSGICQINGPTVADQAQMPFGGMKASGYGRFGGKAVINEFTDLRWITIEGPQHYPF